MTIDTGNMPIPTPPNSNCRFCGKPVIWVNKSPAEIEQIRLRGVDVSDVHRPLDATTVSAGYTIIEGAAYYVYTHQMHVCETPPISREAVETQHVAAAAFYQAQQQTAIRDKNLEVYGSVFDQNQARKKAFKHYTMDIEWDYALVRSCTECTAEAEERCHYKKKPEIILLHPHKRRLTAEDVANIERKQQLWRERN